jgi:hypothetical protein
VESQGSAPEIFIAEGVKTENLAALIGQMFSIFHIGMVYSGCWMVSF